jgi:hypothetical protein
MIRTRFFKQRAPRIIFVMCALLVAQVSSVHVQAQKSTALASSARTPTQTVRQFYQALRAKRFREAFDMSMFRPAIDSLSAAEYEELRPDFEKIAANVPEKVETTGEQISGDTATVFVKIQDVTATNQTQQQAAEPVTLLRVNNEWVVGDRKTAEAIKQIGKDYFFKLRIDTHHSEAQEMLLRIAKAEFAYALEHKGQYADLPTLVAGGLLPKDIQAAETTGYRFHLTLGKDGKSYTAGAEPAIYGRTGRLSFYLDASGIRSSDVGGKAFVPQLDKK